MGCSMITKFKKNQSNPVQEAVVYKNSDIKIQPGTFVQENEHNFNTIYRLGSLIGSGPYIKLHVCYNRETNIKRFVKIYRKDLITNELTKAAIEQEISILKILDHPNIVKIFEYFEEVKRLFLVMEYCKGGDFFSEILKRESLDEYSAANAMQQLFSAVSYMHDNRIVHRNIKPENILLEEKHDVMSLKLHHFGSAKKLKLNKKTSGIVGTAYFMAPEVFVGEYNEKCDL